MRSRVGADTRSAFEIKREATWVLVNIAMAADTAGVAQLVEGNALSPLVAMLSSPDPELVRPPLAGYPARHAPPFSWGGA